MGRRWKKNKNKNGVQKKGANPRHFAGSQQNQQNKNYTPSWQTNRRMEAYYAYQGLHNLYWSEETKSYHECTTDDQRSEEYVNWMGTVTKILPASFRIGVDVDPLIRQRLEQELEELVGREMEITIEEGVTVKIAPAKPIPFVPFGYQLSVDRHTIRKNASLGKLFEWLKIQTEAGFVTRQEAVSMIPPIVMDVHSHHQVLDMCAAPGSKTSQILEIVSKIPEGEREPKGCVVANDADPKRAYMLVHQLKRMHSPVALVTSCDAQFFPLLKNFGDSPEGMFDRVLADVPCSGDGTMRKNPGVWKKWSALNSLNLHPLQLAIALNGARLTKVGGYLCYSTCAMSPIENEAVVAELLRSTDGALELVDRREHLEGMKARPGWSTWKVMREEKSKRVAKNEANKNNAKMQERRRQYENKVNGEEGKAANDETNGEASSEKQAVAATETAESETKEGDSPEEPKSTGGEDPKAPEGQVENTEPDPRAKDETGPEPMGPPKSWEKDALKARCTEEGFTEYQSFEEVEEQWQRTVRRSAFPPTEEEAKTMQLNKCIRILSHDMDTGGFFVALFKKVQPLSQRARDKSAQLAKELRKDVGDAEGRERAPAKKKTKLNPEEAKKDDETPIVESTEESANEMQVDESNGVAGSSSSEQATTEADAGVAKVERTDDSAAEQPLGKIVKGKHARGAPKGNMGNENFVQAWESNITPLVSYYGLSDDFPKDQVMSRANGDSKVFSFIGKAVKQYMHAGLQERITIINSGLKTFERNNQECEVKYRVTQEGIHYLAPYMTNRKFVIGTKDFIKCLRKGAIKIAVLSTELGDRVRALSAGSFMVALEGYENDTAKKLMMVMWRCRGDNVNCLVCQIERDGMKSKMRAITGEELEEEEEETEEEVKPKEDTITDETMEEVTKEEDTRKGEANEDSIVAAEETAA